MNEQGIISCFKAYDLRGRVPEELDEELSYCLGLALSSEFKPARAAVGMDVRLSSPVLAGAMIRAFLEQGVEVSDLGLCGTEEVYFVTAGHAFDLGVMFTASHNPAEYNGIKIVRRGAVPVSGDSGLVALRDRVLRRDFVQSGRPRGLLIHASFQEEYLDFLRSRLRWSGSRSLRLVMNPGNGCAGPILRKLLRDLPMEARIIQEEPDGSFPNGVPNPLLPERRQDTAEAVRRYRADLGLAWDGDFDRCFFFDNEGNFIESYYLIGLLAQNLLAEHPGGKILHDTRLLWNTIEQVREAGGIPVQWKTGHAFMKEGMRREDTVYGGEMSAHHYFRSFNHCDSGMLPWLHLLELLDLGGQSLAELVAVRSRAYPCSGEINFRVPDARSCVEQIRSALAVEIYSEDYMDGLSADCGRWRFNLRSSNTEPLLRLNVESRGNPSLLEDKTAIMERLIYGCGGKRADA